MRAPADGGQAGQVIAGRYRLMTAIGTGGMGTVWLAQDELLGRRVAVKEFTPPPGVTEDESRVLRERTLREARTAARLNHPNVVTIYDVAEDGGRPWIVMELLQARSLREIVQQDGPLSVREVAETGLHLLAALRAAHELGIVHRDVKPGNVLVGEGRTVLADFGIARALDSPAITTSGVLVGSPSFIAPERARGEPGGPASDLWSLGATLYAAVEGRPPYERDGALPTLTAVVTQQPDPPRRSGALWPVISGLLRHDPRQRLSPDAAEAMLARLAREQDPTATAPFPAAAGNGTADRGEAGSGPGNGDETGSGTADWGDAVSGTADRDETGAGTADRDEDAPAGRGALARAERTLTFHPAPVGPGSPAVPAAAALAAPALAGDTSVPGSPEPPGPLTPVGDAGPAEEARSAGDAGPTGDARPARDAGSVRDTEPARDAGSVRDTEPAGDVGSRGPALLSAAGSAPAPPAAQPAAAPPAPPAAQPAAAPPAAHPAAAPPAGRPPASPSAPAPPAGRPLMSRRAGLAAAGVLMVAVAAVLFMLNLPGTTAPPHGRAAGTPTARPGTPQPGRSTAQQPGTSAAGVPAGYHRYRDPTGFSIAVPDGWTVSHQGHLVYIRPPAGARFLLIDQTTHPRPDPLADWRQQEAARIGTYPGYHRIRLQAVSYPQATRAADWEFTYRAPDGPTHVLNRNVLASARHAYALYWSTPAGQWSRSLHIFRVFAATFRPARS